MKRTLIHLTDDLYNKLILAAVRRGKNKQSEVVRDALQTYLKKP